jgi:hypothetical protein
MPWVVGIDEAGYGPNLGPLVQASVAFRLPPEDEAGWETFRLGIRRCRDEEDHRLLIDDSKAIYSRHGFAALERAVLASLLFARTTVGEILRRGTLAGVAIDDVLAGEGWYEPGETAPLAATGEDISAAHAVIRDSMSERVRIGHSQAIVVPAGRFNRVCDEYGSKAVVLSKGLVELIPAALSALESDCEPVLFFCDKHGGRNYYAAMLQEAFPNGWIVPVRETADESRYRVDLLDRPITVVFRPRSDAESIAVALSSMLCKYLREVCMLQFNRYWAKHVPGIRPTAGYPGDAKRFFDEIRPAMLNLGLTDDQVWRKR